ncbi:MAG: thiol-disulfide isomerase-like thioredoxin, partial [Planctomycetaceae bacterium]|nr:thiol-disulfide isomerase-like thioredoxin [Planctomycetaceae bacterium]
WCFGILTCSLLWPLPSVFAQQAVVADEAKPEAKKPEPKKEEAKKEEKPAAVKEAKAAPLVEIKVQGRIRVVGDDKNGADDDPENPVKAPVLPPAQVVPAGPRLNLANGGFLQGEIKDCEQAKILRWQSPGFASPFDFAVNSISSVSVPLAAKPPHPTGEYCFELAGGDILFGSLLSLNGEVAELDVSRFGRLHVARKQIQRLFRWNDSADLIYMGPNGLGGWESAKNQEWREDSGHLVADKDGSAIHSRFELPPQASIEFEVSWTKKPDFELAFGVDNDPKSVPRSFRFEVWDSDLVIQRETDSEADLASLQEIKPGPGRVNLQVFLDQVQGRAIVFSASGKQLASLHVPDPKSKPKTGIRIANKRGDLRLERLRIGRWNGEVPREVEADKSRIHRPDGSIVYGQVQDFDPKSKEFVLKVESGETRIAAGDVQSVVLSQGDEAQPRTVRAVFQDGGRISGELTKVEAGQIWLTAPGIQEPLHSAWTEMQSMVMLAPEAITAEKGVRIGRLEMLGMKLQGQLVPSPKPLTASCLAFQPIGSATASPLLSDASCKLVFRDPPPLVKINPNQPPPVVQAAPRNFLLAPFLGNQPGVARAVPASKGGKRYLHLRTGDTIPCEITRIDEKGITFKTTMSDSTFVGHDKVKAIELANVATEALSIKVSKIKRERLLTLPRMQRDNPPTHLIRSINGDYLRGRLTEMDENKLTMEVRLENREVNRERIAKIIWLHGDELDAAKKAPAVEPMVGTSRVQVLRSDGIRLTFFAEGLEEDVVTGKSEVLGACRADLKQADQLIVGSSIEVAAAELAYQKWKLQHAIEPLAARDDAPGEDGRTPGIESSLVGKAAPDFELDLLDGEGKKLKLSSLQGKVVVLDFFATWCGPCLQAMPQIDKVIEEFKDKDVQLVAVNLEETPAKIKATLERLKLNPTVVLDRDGIVANQYGATAIPQTVVIDSTGKIARLFVGGGPQFEVHLRDAISSLFLPPGTITEEKKQDEEKKTEEKPTEKPAEANAAEDPAEKPNEAKATEDKEQPKS